MTTQAKYDSILNFIRDLYQQPEGFLPLIEPRFVGQEKAFLNDCIDSTFVSYIGKYVTQFEEDVASYTGAKYAIATVSGTTALYMALLLIGLKPGDLVLTQALTFVATANTVRHWGAEPAFIDVDRKSLGMCPEKLGAFLREECEQKSDGYTYHKASQRRIAACIPVHVFGHSVDMEPILNLCNQYHIPIVEDAAEGLGSRYKGKHLGTFGKMGMLSFNGNKIVTTGGGGMILTDDDELAQQAKYLTTTAKVPHRWEYMHDQVGYNFRLPNVNAALGCAQMEQLDGFVKDKRLVQDRYRQFFKELGMNFFSEQPDCYSNYWLNALILDNRTERNAFLEYSNDHQVMTRPCWNLLNKLPMYKDSITTNLEDAEFLEERIVCLPSSARV